MQLWRSCLKEVAAKHCCRVLFCKLEWSCSCLLLSFHVQFDLNLSTLHSSLNYP